MAPSEFFNTGPEEKDEEEIEDSNLINDFNELKTSYEILTYKLDSHLNDSGRMIVPIYEELMGGNDSDGMIDDTLKVIKDTPMIARMDIGKKMISVVEKIDHYISWVTRHNTFLEAFLFKKGFVYFIDSAIEMIDKRDKKIEQLMFQIKKMEAQIEDISEPKKTSPKAKESSNTALTRAEMSVLRDSYLNLFEKYKQGVIDGDGRYAGGMKGRIIRLGQNHAGKKAYIEFWLKEDLEKLDKDPTFKELLKRFKQKRPKNPPENLLSYPELPSKIKEDVPKTGDYGEDVSTPPK